MSSQAPPQTAPPVKHRRSPYERPTSRTSPPPSSAAHEPHDRATPQGYLPPHAHAEYLVIGARPYARHARWRWNRRWRRHRDGGGVGMSGGGGGGGGGTAGVPVIHTDSAVIYAAVETPVIGIGRQRSAVPTSGSPLALGGLRWTTVQYIAIIHPPESTGDQ
ncbi:hypothetical protein FB451DRAFT_1174429 [Mycena latifolia]|nr:hypothetical protein FB451DRAFT_1174429 [Mycena latifolia]